MAIATLLFWGDSFKSHGLPNQFFSYLISVSRNQVIGYHDKIVKITPMTEDTPKPLKEGAMVVRNADADQALDAAFRLLEGMECLKGLNKHRSIADNSLIKVAAEKAISFKEV